MNRKPLVSCLCPTYARRDRLERAVYYFCGQDYSNAELIILDDFGDIPVFKFSRVKVVSTHLRFSSLPAKYNALAAMAQGDVFAIWEDDDIYHPWHLRAHLWAMQHDVAVWSKPRKCFQQIEGATLLREDCDRLRRFHASLAFTRDAFDSVGGYTVTRRADFDRQFQQKMLDAFGEPANYTQEFGPAYTHVWGSDHGSLFMKGDADEGWYDEAARSRHD